MDRRNNEKFGIQVCARPNESPERMIKRFVKKVRESGILQEFNQRRFYEKPGVKKRRKKSLAKWNFLKTVEKDAKEKNKSR